MREFYGKAVGITSPITGVVSSDWLIMSGKNKIILIKDQEKGEFKNPLIKPAAFIVSRGAKLSFSIPSIIDFPPDDCFALKDGDILLLDPSGKITLLYDICSNDNAIIVTNRCNCNCIMCPQPPDRDPENIFEWILLLISLMKDKKGGHLGITGGEPTILGEKLIRVVTALRKQLPNAAMTLLTNGKKLSDFDFSKQLVATGWPNLTIEIPLYSDIDEHHDFIVGANGSFYETIEGLHNLALLKQPVGLRTVLHSKTIPRLVQYSEFIYRNLPFVFQVAFMGMETTGIAKDNLDDLWVDPYNYQEILSNAVHHLARRNVPASIYNHPLCLLPMDLWSFARKSISTWKEKYFPDCEECSLKSICGGIFGTNYKNSEFMHPFSQKDIPQEWQDKINGLKQMLGSKY